MLNERRMSAISTASRNDNVFRQTSRRISVYFDEFYRHKVFKKKKQQTSKLQVTYLEMSEAPGNHKVANLIFKLSLIREGFHETSWFEREFLRQIWHFDNYQKSLATRHAVSLVEFSESFTYHYCSSCVTITYKPIWLTEFLYMFVALQFMCTDWEEIWSWMSRSRGKWTSVWTGRKCW